MARAVNLIALMTTILGYLTIITANRTSSVGAQGPINSQGISVSSRFPTSDPPSPSTFFKFEGNSIFVSLGSVNGTCSHIYLLSDKSSPIKPPYYKINFCNDSLSIDSHEKQLVEFKSTPSNLYSFVGTNKNKIGHFRVQRISDAISVKKVAATKPLIKYVSEGTLKNFHPTYYALNGTGSWKVYPNPKAGLFI